MTPLQAAMKDKSSKKWSEKKVMYKVGSCFKACSHCADAKYLIDENGREIMRYLTGMQVFRSYHPSQVGWTYWCWDCGAKDLQCWEGAVDIGMDPILGNADSVSRGRMARRKEFARNNQEIIPSRVEKISQMESELKRLMRLLEGVI